MAQYNEILEGGLNNLIVKRLGMQTGTAVPAVQPEMTMDLTLENDRPEWGFLKGEFRYSRSRLVAAPGAGLHAGVTIENQASSGMLVVVEECHASAFSRVSLVTSLAGFSAGDAGYARDGRQPTRSRCFLNQYAVPTASLPPIGSLIPAGSVSQLAYIIPPGWYLAVVAGAANVACDFSLAWIERPLLAGELG